MAGSLLLGGAAANADKSGGTLSFLVQPEPPTLASYGLHQDRLAL